MTAKSLVCPIPPQVMAFGGGGGGYRHEHNSWAIGVLQEGKGAINLIPMGQRWRRKVDMIRTWHDLQDKIPRNSKDYLIFHRDSFSLDALRYI